MRADPAHRLFVVHYFNLNYSLLYSKGDGAGGKLPADLTRSNLDELFDLRPHALELLRCVVQTQRDGICTLGFFAPWRSQCKLLLPNIFQFTFCFLFLNVCLSACLFACLRG